MKFNKVQPGEVEIPTPPLPDFRAKKIVFIGDSITDTGRRQDFYPYGKGYVSIFRDLLISLYPEQSTEIINKGISGDNIPGLRERWEDDVISQSPDWLSILIGINDLHQAVRHGLSEFDPENYYRNYKECLEITQKMLSPNIILITPFYISRANTMDTFRKKVLESIPAYIEKVEKLSREFSTLFLNLHEIFQAKLATYEPETFAPEPIHPNRTGHTVIAVELMKTLGLIK
ncbi:MAG: SGNH/GDSL hydrolase family protein [Caldiserica bacterium]|nr:SGNH/GDSL hydrolase family protein [Caldisericota bacterium]